MDYTHYFGIDISTYNMRTTTGQVMAMAPTALEVLDPKDPNAIYKQAARRRAHNPNSGRTNAAMKAAAPVTYIAPDFVTMRRDGWCHPEFVYIKAAHGTAGPGNVAQYPISAYITPAKAAQAAGWAFFPYHFYYMDMPSRAQGDCFVNSLIDGCKGDLSLFGTGNPISDLEDSASTRYKSMLWDGNPGVTFDRCKANAKDFLQYVYPLYLTTIDNSLSNLLGRVVTTQIYSGNWFWQPIINLMKIGTSIEDQKVLDFYANRTALGAFYTPNHLPPSIVTDAMKLAYCDNRVIQFTSTSVPPMVGLNSPGMDGVMGSSLDINYYHADPSHYLYWTGLSKLLPAPGTIDPPIPPTPVDDPLVKINARLDALEAKMDLHKL